MLRAQRSEGWGLEGKRSVGTSAAKYLPKYFCYLRWHLSCSMWRTRPTRARPAPREMHALLQRCSSFWPPTPTPFPCHRAATNTPANAASIFILINYKMANVAESSTLMDCLVASLTQESLLSRGCGVVSIETRII